MFAGFIFDVEGTLVDSVPQNIRSLQDALERQGYRVPYQTLKLIKHPKGQRSAPTQRGTCPIENGGPGASNLAIPNAFTCIDRRCCSDNPRDRISNRQPARAGILAIAATITAAFQSR